MSKKYQSYTFAFCLILLSFFLFQNFLYTPSGPYSGQLTQIQNGRSLPKTWTSGLANVPGGRLSMATLAITTDKPNLAGWRARVLVHSSAELTLSPDQTEMNINSKTPAVSAKNLVYKDNSFNPMLWSNPMNTAGHHTVSFDARYAETAFRVRNISDCTDGQAGSILADPRGVYECYKLILYGPLKPADQAGVLIPHRALATVVVRSFVNTAEHFQDRLESPVIEVATQDSPWYEMKFKANLNDPNEPQNSYRAYEMSVTADGRLVFLTRLPGGEGLWNNVRYEAFTFNPRPWDPASVWTVPYRYSEGNAYLGAAQFCLSTRPGSTEASCPGGMKVALKDRYPVLAQPLKMPDGSAFTGMRECSYPWLSFDGEEIFCNMMTSSGFSVAGRRTNWTWMLIDNSLNRVRERYTLINQNNLRFCRDDEKEPESGRCSGMLAATSVGMSSGTWTMPSDLNLTKFNFGLTPDSYLMGLTGYARMVDGKWTIRRFLDLVSFPFQDEKSLLHMSMNEMLSEQPESRPGIAGTFNRHSWDLSRTPDTSGNFITGTLQGDVHFFHGGPNGEGGLAAPYDDRNNHLKWSGSFLNFGSGSSVVARPPSSNAQLVDYFGNQAWFEFTLSFAIMMQKSVSARTLIFEKPGMFSIWIHPSGNLEFEANVNQMGIVKSGEIPFPISPGSLSAPAWNHVTIRYAAAIGLSVDIACAHTACSAPSFVMKQIPLKKSSGAVLTSPETKALVGASAAEVRIGPQNTGPGGKIYFLDELDLAVKNRTEIETRAAQFRTWDSSSIRPEVLPSFLDLQGKHLGLDAETVITSSNLAQFMSDADRFKKLACVGKKLFSDVEISRNAQGVNQGVSCATCHIPSKSFTDGKTVSIGVGGLTTGINAPTLVNRLFSTRQMLDQRSLMLTTQASMPLTNPLEMNADTGAVVSYVNQSYKADFATVFPGLKTLTMAQVNYALSSYMSMLISGGSKFDQMLAQDIPVSMGSAVKTYDQLTEEERIYRGYQIFVGKGRCVACHSSGNFTDEVGHNTGLGRRVKTPTLREIAFTAPFMHDGSRINLIDAVNHYSTGGRDKNHRTEIVALVLEHEEKLALVKFMQSLSAGSRPLEAISCK